MPKKGRKSKTDKKRKHRLSTEEILKLIKKVRPKQSQSVRVNIGDGSGKKTSQPPALLPQPIVTYGMPMPNTPTFTQSMPNAPEPVKIPVPLYKTPAPETIKIKTEKPINLFDYPGGASLVRMRQTAELERAKKFTPKQFPPRVVDTSGYVSDASELTSTSYDYSNSGSSSGSTGSSTMSNPIGALNTGISLGLGGGMSMSIKPSALGFSSSLPTHYGSPIQNDIYLPAFPAIENDQSGNVATQLSSEEFMLTPEGENAPLTETNPDSIPQAAVSEGAVMTTPARPLPLGPSPDKPTIKREPGNATPMIDFLNAKIDAGEFKVDPIYIAKSGKNKGHLKAGTSAMIINGLMSEYENINKLNA